MTSPTHYSINAGFASASLFVAPPEFGLGMFMAASLPDLDYMVIKKEKYQLAFLLGVIAAAIAIIGYFANWKIDTIATSYIIWTIFSMWTLKRLKYLPYYFYAPVLLPLFVMVLIDNKKHRGISHSLIGWITFTITIILFGYWLSPNILQFALGSSAGYLLHLFADCFNKTGIKWFYPLSKKTCSIPYAKGRYVRNSITLRRMAKDGFELRTKYQKEVVKDKSEPIVFVLFAFITATNLALFFYLHQDLLKGLKSLL